MPLRKFSLKFLVFSLEKKFYFLKYKEFIRKLLLSLKIPRVFIRIFLRLISLHFLKNSLYFKKLATKFSTLFLKEKVVSDSLCFPYPKENFLTFPYFSLLFPYFFIDWVFLNQRRCDITVLSRAIKIRMRGWNGLKSLF